MVDGIAYDPKGDRLATSCHDGKVRIWDIKKGNAVHTMTHMTPNNMTQQPPAVYCVAWSPDGKQLASGGLDYSIKIWNAADGKLVKEIKGFNEKTSPKGHHDGVFCIAYSPDGKQIVSGSSDRTIKVWNAVDGNFIRELVSPNLKPSPMQPPTAHPGWVYYLRFMPDGKLVSVGDAPRSRGYIAVWNPADGKLLAASELSLGRFYGVAAGPDGTFVVACGPRGRQVPQADAVLLKLAK
jgi:WD40 repeat protein